MLKRIQRAVKAFKAPKDIPEEELRSVLSDDLGDGKAEFLGEGTQDEYRESEKEKRGLKGIFGL